MPLKLAVFQPTILAMDEVPPNIYSKIFSLTENLHSFVSTSDTTNMSGGHYATVYPDESLNTKWLIDWIESICQNYMDLISTQSSSEDLKYCKPVVTDIRTLRQYENDYVEMYTHVGSHISGNVYVQVPELDANSKPTDSQALFRMPQTKDITKFIMNDTLKFIPRQATMILFPSHVPNTLYPWRGTGYRTILSFNTILRPKDE